MSPALRAVSLPHEPPGKPSRPQIPSFSLHDPRSPQACVFIFWSHFPPSAEEENIFKRRKLLQRGYYSQMSSQMLTAVASLY